MSIISIINVVSADFHYRGIDLLNIMRFKILLKQEKPENTTEEKLSFTQVASQMPTQFYLVGKMKLRMKRKLSRGKKDAHVHTACLHITEGRQGRSLKLHRSVIYSIHSLRETVQCFGFKAMQSQGKIWLLGSRQMQLFVPPCALKHLLRNIPPKHYYFEG